MNADLRPVRTKAELALVDTFTAARPNLPGGKAVAQLRTIAFERFAAEGLPHARVEAWKYTDLRRFMREAKPLAGKPEAAAKERARDAGALLAGAGLRRVVIVDGKFAADLSDLADLDKGLSIQPMVDALVSDDLLRAQRLSPTMADDPMLSLNTALAADGVVIEISPGAVLTRPIHLVFVTTGESAAAVYIKSQVVIGSGARATVVETHEGPNGSDYQVNSALQLIVGDDAEVEHIKVTREGDAALHVGTLVTSVGARANFREFGFSVGGAVVRNQLFVRLAGEGTNAGIYGATLLAGRQHADTTLLVDHLAPNSQSREIFKSVVDDEACAVFQGKIAVRPGAQKTDAKMMARGLLLSDQAEVDCKPELEIFADDVQCGHGSTTGALDDQLKFYLMARGIPAKQAEALLIQAFVGEVVEAIAQDGVREALLNAMTTWLAERG
ncbi:Fe-S cluster assembly protein SufD [Bradyrhizobium sp.]|uniref:Fe-S cluster assembly protein SufD n=1 Tax=Bradyrhizobium sp. TaxID=376 RepID=UPI003C3DF671